MKNPFNLKLSKDTFVINPAWMVHFSEEWEFLSKYQKALIRWLLFSTRSESKSRMAEICGCKTNKAKFNKELDLLISYGVLDVKKFCSDDLKEIPLEYHPEKITKLTLTYRLTHDWYLNLIKSNVEEQSFNNNRLHYKGVKK